MNIRLKDLSKLGYTDNVARSLAITIVGKHCKHKTKEQIAEALKDILGNPDKYKGDQVWGKLAEHFSPTPREQKFKVYTLNRDILPYKTYGGAVIGQAARQQMDVAMRLPVTLAGALMPDAHSGYGLPIGGVLATRDAVIPYAVGMDIGCRMSLTVFDAGPEFTERYAHRINEALREFTHFGINGGLGIRQEHPVLDRPEFGQTQLLKTLHGKAVRQLGTSGGGNHFVEFGWVELFEGNFMNLPSGSYTALVSHSGSRGVGAAIARHYSSIAREVCKLPREAVNFAWLDLDSEAGQEYWISMKLAGDFAVACHEQIHMYLAKALGLHALSNVSNHHYLAWREEIAPGQFGIVHRKGATPAHNGTAGIIPGSMSKPGYLVTGKGTAESLNSAAHGAGRVMSRQKAKQQFTRSSLNKMLIQQGITLLGGSVEECPMVYKDIDRVMRAQQDLVDVHGRFMPRIVRMNKE